MKPGTLVRCRVELDIEGIPPIEVGAEAEILEQFETATMIRVGYFGGYHVDQLRGDFVYYWDPISEPLPARARAKRGMIVDRHPDTPGKPSDKKHIGFWAASADPDADEYEAKGIQLPWPADHVDELWNKAKRNIVARYLKETTDVEFWRGFSFCRMGCGEASGTTDKGDDIYVWPAGFAHYVEAHGVRPPEEFVDHVLKKTGFHFDFGPED